MVHSAFKAVCLVPESRVKVESVALWGDRLLVGCLDGSLQVYAPPQGAESSDGAPYALIEKRVGFGKKSVVQLDVLQSRALLVSLSDGVSLHTLPELDLVTHLHKSRGATSYALHPPAGLLAVALRRKLLVYAYDAANKDDVSVSEKADVSIPDAVRTMAWAGEGAVCVGIGRQYSLVNVQTRTMTDVFPSGRIGPPVAAVLPEGGLLLSKDNIGVFVDAAGKPTRTGGLSWSEPPASVIASPPYIIARLTRFVEVRSLRPPHSLVQTVPLRSMTMLTSAPAGSALVADDKAVYRLQPVDVAAQISQLLAARQYEDALLLCQQLQGEEAQSRAAREDEIHTRYAEDLFQRGEYESAMAHFAASPLDLPSLLSRYPSIELPSLEPEFQFRTGPDTSAKTNTERPVSRESSLSPTVANSPLAGHTLTRALKVLAEFLTLKRPGIVTLVEPRQSSIGSVNKASSDHSPAESAPSHGLSPQHQATLLDTALLQALLSTDSVKQARQLLEGPNFCHVATCEPLLSAAGRFEELLALFKSHGAHREALDLLKRLAEDGSGGSAFGHERLAEYLKQLGSEHTGLVLDYSKWLLEAHPDAGFALFKNLDPPIPPQTVLAHLRTHAPQLSAAYLEHILGGSEGSQPPSLPATPPQLSRLSSSSFGGDSFGGESTPPAAKTPTEDEGLSKELVHLYLERVLEEAKAGGFPKRGFEAENGTAERENKWDERAKSETRLKLLSSLERSTAYDPRRLLSEIPDGILLYERAILLGRLGKHRQALFLYARALRDPPAAEEYCRRLHEEGGHVAGGIEQSIGVDTGAVIGGRGQGERGGEGRVVGGPRKGETEGVNMFLTLLEVYLDPHVGASDVPSHHRDPNEDSPRGTTSNPDTVSTSGAGADVQVLPGGTRRGSSTPRNRKARNLQPHLESARASSQSSGSEEAAFRNGPGLGAVSTNQEIMLDDALRLLVRFWDRIDGAKAVRLLPGTVEIGRLIPFLGPLLRRISEGKRNAAVVKSLRRSENLQVRDRLLEERRRSFRVTGGTVCNLCHKKIGTSVFAVHPDNRLVHFSCYKEAGAAS